MGAVDVLDVAPLQGHLAFGFCQGLIQSMEVAQVVFFAKEAQLPIVAALDDVQRDAIKLDAAAAGHGFMLAQEE